MMFVLIKKKKLLISALITIGMIVTLLLTYLTDAYIVASGRTTRKLPIYCVDTNEKKVALSFDASWGADKTENILAILTEYDVSANFFAVGFWAERYSEKLKMLHESGRMEIGTHSNTHAHMSKLSKREVERELDESCRVIESIIGRKPTLFRAPFGEYNDTLLETAEEKGLFTIQWDVDTLDWKGIKAGEMAARVLNKVQNGSIVLMHNDGEHTVEGLKNKGYTFTVISNLIYKENYEIDHTGKQIQKEG